MERRLAAIMFVDIVGYTALMAESEARGLRARARHRSLVRPLVERYHGEAVEARGDESLAVFPTALDAVNCALAIEGALVDEGELRLHIGIHVGDFVVEGGEVSGDAVNIAARVRSFSEAGVCVSAEVYHSVRNHPNIEAQALGEHELKNVGRPIALFQLRGTPVLPSARAPSSGAASARGPIRSLAVLPLENLSGDPAQEYFADGMTETLIGDLGRLRALRVISRTSVMRYKGVRRSLPEIAAELGVDALLEGSVMREGARVRVTAQLIDGRTDHHLWSERYDRDLRGVLELQSDVARAIARRIELELSPGTSAKLADPRSVEPTAHDALLEGIHQIARSTPEATRRGIACLERALELDPGYALAHARLGSALYLLGQQFRVVANSEVMPKAKAAALRALELDGALAEAHGVLGSVAFAFDWDWPASEHHIEVALELNPSLAQCRTLYAFHLVTRGRNEAAIAQARRAIELDPFDLSRRSALVTVLRLSRRYVEALDVARRIEAIDPTLPQVHREHAWVLEHLGRHDEAIAVYERGGLLGPADGAALRAALSRDGPRGFLREALRIGLHPPGWRHYYLATFHAQLGHQHEAVAELGRAYSAREGGLVSLRVDPRFDSLRADPRFAELVRRVGIPAD